MATLRGMGGDNQTSERVVSQLLTELDGIQSLSGVIVLAATNRMDIVDPALVRAGRFDKLLYIPQPDRYARKQIIEIHTRGKQIASGIEVDRLVDLTDGLSGADITAVINTAVSLVLQEFISAYPKPEEVKKHISEAIVSLKHFEEAVRKVRSSREGKPLERLAVSYYR